MVNFTLQTVMLYQPELFRTLQGMNKTFQIAKNSICTNSKDGKQSNVDADEPYYSGKIYLGDFQKLACH